MSPIYLLTGMNPSPRIFARLLPLLPSAVVVPWIKPLSGESIPNYSERLAACINTAAVDEADRATRDGHVTAPIICGTSFGGIIAPYVAAQLRARACVIISSVAAPHQLPPHLRAAAKLAPFATDRTLAGLGAAAKFLPAAVRTDSTTRLSKLARHTNPAAGAPTTPHIDHAHWYRWATSAFLRWANADHAGNAVNLTPGTTRFTHIHGTRDATFPMRYISADVAIPGGTHLLVLAHAAQIGAILDRHSSSPATPNL